MRREERVTVQGPVKKQQHDGMSHGGGALAMCPRPRGRFCPGTSVPYNTAERQLVPPPCASVSPCAPSIALRPQVVTETGRPDFQLMHPAGVVPASTLQTMVSAFMVVSIPVPVRAMLNRMCQRYDRGVLRDLGGYPITHCKLAVDIGCTSSLVVLNRLDAYVRLASMRPDVQLQAVAQFTGDWRLQKSAETVQRVWQWLRGRWFGSKMGALPTEEMLKRSALEQEWQQQCHALMWRDLEEQVCLGRCLDRGSGKLDRTHLPAQNLFFPRIPAQRG